MRSRRHRRTVSLIRLSASLLIAGANEVKTIPVLVRAPLARNVYPRNVNAVCLCCPRVLSRLQYTILVLSRCSRNPTSTVLSPIALATMMAWAC